MDFEGCVVVTGIGTSVSYHIASFGIALIKGKDFDSRNRISSYNFGGFFRMLITEKGGEKVDLRAAF